ncbi:bile acid:sodium symporter [Aeromonas hydrophila]|nr:bile acid:sodium symporter [Aeromonas hydrophila]
MRLDPFTSVLIVVVALASFFPCEGQVAVWFGLLTKLAVALLFFMHGAKLSRQNLLAGLGHWRLHLVVMASTFVLFPLLGLLLTPLGLLLTPLVPHWLSPAIYLGFLYLCALPATVQSAIAFTSMAGGNVSAAVCSASASSILGIFLSPVLVGLMINVQGEGVDTWHSIQAIMVQLMLPFVVGHLSRPLIGRWVDSHRPLIGKLDQSSILLVVYVAFSEAVVQGIWHQVGWYDLASIVLLSCVLLALVLGWNVWISRRLGFDRADEITIVFCGSKKSLANGVPMANVMFPAASVGVMVLPLMIFHQIQLMVCAVLARRYHEQEALPQVQQG